MRALRSPWEKRLGRFLMLGVSTLLLILLISLRSEAINTQVVHGRMTGINTLSHETKSTIHISDKLDIDHGYLADQASDRLNQSVTLSNRALTHQQNGQFAEAQQAIAKSLAILQFLPKNPEQQRIYSASLDIQGQIHNTQGSPAQALETWKQAEQIYKNLNFPALITNNQINQAIAMQQLGLYPRACQTLLTSLGQGNQSCPLNETSLPRYHLSPSPILQVEPNDNWALCCYPWATLSKPTKF